jgi:hypothetical protein
VDLARGIQCGELTVFPLPFIQVVLLQSERDRLAVIFTYFTLQVLPVKFSSWLNSWVICAFPIYRSFSHSTKKVVFLLYFDLGFELRACFGGGIIFRHEYLDLSFRLDPEPSKPSIHLAIFRGRLQLPT